ncbi:MAG: MopE-related protein [Myxococcota bacterium]
MKRVAWAFVAVLALAASERAEAFISQTDGVVVPAGSNMQACLDRAGTGEGTGAGGTPILRAQADAMILPEAFRPVEDPPGSGNYPVTFRMIGEGAGFRNIFGYYYVDEDVTNPANLRMVFDCRPNSGGFDGGSCNCPCDPLAMRRTDGSDESWERTLNFQDEPGFAPGRAIGFFIRTPELFDGTRDSANSQCGGPSAANNDHRTYYTSQALNDDGDFVHFLIYESITFNNTYYFGFEDLFRGGDNDFEDALARVTGLVPTCVPQLESCNGEDDDCDLNVDEGIETACSTACGPGVQVCSDGAFGACSAPVPSAELCDGLDNDCDTRFDEGLTQACMNSCGSGTEICRSGAFVECSAPTPEIESCNDADDDCDGSTDEELTRACSTACGSGTETCSEGAFVGCTAPEPVPESCNGADDDCDGRTDEGISRACSTDCGTGTEICVAGEFVGCTAQAPRPEACNDTDDDCDGMTDEGLVRTCSSACGLGEETCEAGVFAGCTAPAAGVEVCNGLDDDCDGVVDDGNPGGGASCVPDADGGFTIVDGVDPEERCVPGTVVCVGGELSCRGATSPSPEICNCEDDDCDGEVDEDEGGLCPGDGACIDCTCLTPCDAGEFPCPPGRVCDRELGGDDGFCVAGRCADVECAETEICNPNTGECRDLCEGISCPTDTTCIRGICVEDNCYGRGCDPGLRCAEGVCEADPCLDVSCDEGSFCRDGECIAACAEGCAEGEICSAGTCIEDPCGGCTSSESCIEGACVLNDCAEPCGRRRVCIANSCVDDPCGFIDCPSGTSCNAGECIAGRVSGPPEPILALASGGGGCACDAAGASSRSGPPMPAILTLGLLLLALRRRRQTPRLVRAPARLLRALGLASVLVFSGGCDVEPFCLENCDGEDGGTDGGIDVRIESGTTDGCIPTGEETCNGLDEDCDGRADEDFDLNADPRNCGACLQECILPGAFPGCDTGACVVDRCEIGFHDLDGNGTNGCEYACLETGDELCDGRDNDCDGNTDEGFDTNTDLGNCGVCGNVCAFNNATARCEGGTCVQDACNAGFVDANGESEDGCELGCVPAGDEVCNGADDNCDGRTDEGFDTSSDPLNCGRCGVACTFVNADATCSGGVCSAGGCAPGFFDVDGLAGCEYACTPTGADVCNNNDDDCDGRIDEGDPVVGTACGETRGECEAGVSACQRGAIVCVGGRGPTPETCDGLDENCNGVADDGVLPGVGARCGDTNVGRCSFGSVVCVDGALECGGALVEARSEQCNGLDDNCNGVPDDGAAPPSSTPPSCALTAGVCAGRTPVCNGSAGYACAFPDTFQSVETRCDGLDNDCDSRTDEGCLSVQGGSDRRLDTGEAAGGSNSVQPFVAADGAGVYAAWMDLRNGNAQAFYARSNNAGASFSAPFRLDENGGPAFGPRVIFSAPDVVNTFWADFRGGTNFREIMNRRSTNEGLTFGSVRRINPGMDDDSFNLRIASSGDRVYAVYEAFTSARNRHIFLLYSSDAGANWTGPVQVDNGDEAITPNFVAASPEVAASGTDVHIVWRDNRLGALDVYYARSTNGGVTLPSSDRRLDVGNGASFSPVVAAEGSNVYVAWVDDRSGTAFDINFARSDSRGASFSTAVNIDDDPLPHDSIEPVIVAPTAGVVALAWVDFRSGFSDVIVRRSETAGASFDDAVRVDTGTAPGTSGSFDVALAADGDTIGVAWADDRAGALDIYANFSLDGGATFQPDDYRLDSTAEGAFDSSTPSIAVSGTSLHVVWVDNRTTSPNGDIHYRAMAP